MDRQDHTLIEWEIYQELDRRVIELAPIIDLVASIERLRRLTKARREIDLLGSVFRRAIAREIIKRDCLGITDKGKK